MQALILAGGRGMRLAPLTDEVPQALLYLPGGTILDYLLHHVAILEPQETALILQYRGDRIARRLAERPALRLIPQDSPFTLLSALASAAEWVHSPTLVLHGDSYFSHDLRPFLNQADPERPTFLVARYTPSNGHPFESGAYLLPPAAFQVAAHLKRQRSLRPFYEALIREGLYPAQVPYQGWSRHIATPADLLTVNRYLLTRWHEAMHPPQANLGYDALNLNWVASDAEVDDRSHCLFVTVGPGAHVVGSHLYNALLLPGVGLRAMNDQHVVLAGEGTRLMRLYTPRPSTAWAIA